ncbi:hypothetical protein EV182_005290 [Spiromyces aspiralis]|uniref:Uncharacterized protein n=1 Tax=Spiromyces aspiralis TaxID=68401 RepID=A0ACC1HVE0_9FUNG|nr:hypothetical protein EV182_005290 [Spiromyces aspiralis]
MIPGGYRNINALFDPPMWEQRRRRIADIVTEVRPSSILELGCGEGNILSFLIPPSDDDEHPISRIVGLDIDECEIEKAAQRCKPNGWDHQYPRCDPLQVQLYHGSAAVPVGEFKGIDFIICSEVIEHMPTEDLELVAKTLFGVYQPRVCIVTTPNAEFNVYFPELNYGTPNSRFRHNDHHFEWTRQEFYDWQVAPGEARMLVPLPMCECMCTRMAGIYGYDFRVEGIGKLVNSEALKAYTGPDVGCCTQIAVFSKRSGAGLSCKASREDYIKGSERHPIPTHAITFEYPVAKDQPLSPTHLRDLVVRYAGYIMDVKTGVFKFEELWQVWAVKSQFRRRRRLKEWLDEQCHHGLEFKLISNSGYTSQYQLLA